MGLFIIFNYAWLGWNGFVVDSIRYSYMGLEICYSSANFPIEVDWLSSTVNY